MYLVFTILVAISATIFIFALNYLRINVYYNNHLDEYEKSFIIQGNKYGYDINGKTIYEIAKILVHLFVPIPSVGDLNNLSSPS